LDPILLDPVEVVFGCLVFEFVEEVLDVVVDGVEAAALVGRGERDVGREDEVVRHLTTLGVR
jgi:hypothetical protein